MFWDAFIWDMWEHLIVFENDCNCMLLCIISCLWCIFIWILITELHLIWIYLHLFVSIWIWCWCIETCIYMWWLHVEVFIWVLIENDNACTTLFIWMTLFIWLLIEEKIWYNEFACKHVVIYRWLICWLFWLTDVYRMNFANELLHVFMN